MGCGAEQTLETETKEEMEGASIYENHLDLSIAYWEIDNALENRENDIVLQTLEEKFNVTIEPANITRFICGQIQQLCRMCS